MNKAVTDRILHTVSHIPILIIPVILLFSIIFSFLINKVIDNKYKPKNTVFSENARWIKPAFANDRAYYRRDFVLSEKPLQGWLSIAGIDTFEVYINGKPLANEEYLGGKPVGTYDIHHMLTPGNNTIAAMSGSSSTDITAQMIMQLDLLTASGKYQLFSDPFWKSINYEPFKKKDKEGNKYWYENDYDISHWDNAVIARDFKELIDLSPKLSEKVLNELKKVYFFWYKEKISPYMTVERNITVKNKDIDDVRIGVSIDGYYKININGYKVSNNNAHVNQVVLHNITGYINNGNNRITIELYCSDIANKAAVFGSILYADGEVKTFSSDSGWSIQKPNPNQALAFFQPKAILPQFLAGRLEESAEFNVDRYVKSAVHTIWVFMAILIIGCLVTNIDDDSKSVQSRWRTFLFPYSVSALLMLLLSSITLDPAFSLSPMTLRLILLVGVLVTVFFSVFSGNSVNRLFKGIR